jgi:hypothetical protein
MPKGIKMADFLSEADGMPNLNAATIAGKVIKVESLTGKSVGRSFVVGYQKHWPSGGVQEIPIKCYLTGVERVEKANWLKPGEVVVVHGEVTDRGAVYAHQLEQLSQPERVPGADDEFLAGMQRTSSHCYRSRDRTGG